MERLKAAKTDKCVALRHASFRCRTSRFRAFGSQVVRPVNRDKTLAGILSAAAAAWAAGAGNSRARSSLLVSRTCWTVLGLYAESCPTSRWLLGLTAAHPWNSLARQLTSQLRSGGRWGRPECIGRPPCQGRFASRLRRDQVASRPDPLTWSLSAANEQAPWAGSACPPLTRAPPPAAADSWELWRATLASSSRQLVRAQLARCARLLVCAQLARCARLLVCSSAPSSPAVHACSSARLRPARPLCTPARPLCTPARPLCTPARPLCTPGCPLCTPGCPLCTPGRPLCTPARPRPARRCPWPRPAWLGNSRALCPCTSTQPRSSPLICSAVEVAVPLTCWTVVGLYAENCPTSRCLVVGQEVRPDAVIAVPSDIPCPVR